MRSFFFFSFSLQPSFTRDINQRLFVVATHVNRSRGIGTEDGLQQGLAKLLLCCLFVIETTAKDPSPRRVRLIDSPSFAMEKGR